MLTILRVIDTTLGRSPIAQNAIKYIIPCEVTIEIGPYPQDLRKYRPP